MKVYEKYKNTEIEWLDKIPEHWERTKLKFLSSFVNGYSFKSESYDKLGEFPVLTIANVQSYRLDMSEYNSVKFVPKDIRKEQILHKGDMLISMTGNVGRVCFVDIDNCLLNQRVGKIIVKEKVCKEFVFYVLSSSDFIKYLTINADGSAQQNASKYSICNYSFALPPYDEQKRIADFLNAKTSELDAEKQNLQKQIEVLSELRQVIITNIVTKGIDNAVKTKDSGQDWIGNIPLHWKAKRFKYIGKCHNGLTYSPNDVCDENEGVLVLRSSNIQNSKLSFEDNVYVKTVPSKLMVKKGDVIICSRNGSISLVGKSAYVDEDINATYGAFMLRFRTNEDSKFMYYLLQQAIKFYKGLCFTTTVNQLTNEIFDNMWGVVPPIDEQKAIADYLDKKTAEIDEQIQLQEQQIKLIDELKQSIISQAVTGKIKVF